MKLKKENDVTYYDSTNILFSTYDPSEEKLYICFTKGNVYIYQGISNELNNSFEESESQGKFFLENIKNKFSFTKELNKLGDFEKEGVKSFIEQLKKEINN